MVERCKESFPVGRRPVRPSHSRMVRLKLWVAMQGPRGDTETPQRFCRMCCAGHATKGRGWLRWVWDIVRRLGWTRAGEGRPGGCRKHEAGPVITIVYRNPCRSALHEKRTLNAPAQSQGPSTDAVKRAGPRRARPGAGGEGGSGGGVVLRGGGK
jgi:hypothetical protein